MSVTYLLDTELGMNVPADCNSNKDQHLDVYREIRIIAMRGTCLTCFVSGCWTSGFSSGGSHWKRWIKTFNYDSTSLTFMIFIHYFLLESGISCRPTEDERIHSSPINIVLRLKVFSTSCHRGDSLRCYCLFHTIRHIGWTIQIDASWPA